MPREKHTPKTVGRRPASRETLAELKEHFDKGTRLTMKELADLLNLTESTVKYHKGKWRNGEWGELNKCRDLTNEEEAAITKTLKKWKLEGKILSPRIVRQLAYNYCEKQGLGHIIEKWGKGLASYDWFIGYAKRNKDVMSILHVSPLMDRKRGRREERNTKTKRTRVEESDNDSPPEYIPVKKTRAGRIVKPIAPATSVKANKKELAAGKNVSEDSSKSAPPNLNGSDEKEAREQNQVSATVDSLVDRVAETISMEFTEKKIPHSRLDLDRIKKAAVEKINEGSLE